MLLGIADEPPISLNDGGTIRDGVHPELDDVNISLKLAPAAVVVPYQYSLIIWGVLMGYLVFGEMSDMPTFIGAAVIIAAGLFIFFREQQLRRHAVSSPKP